MTAAGVAAVRSGSGRSFGSGRNDDDDWSGPVIGGGGSHRDRVVEAALKPAPPTPSGADQLGLQVGDDVEHPKFGDGVITAVEGTGDKTVAHVHFAGGVGTKQLLLAWAPLTKR